MSPSLVILMWLPATSRTTPSGVKEKLSLPRMSVSSFISAFVPPRRIWSLSM